MTSRQATGFQDFEKTPPNRFGVDANGDALRGGTATFAGAAKRLAINRYCERLLKRYT